jgi:hypothetical protein
MRHRWFELKKRRLQFELQDGIHNLPDCYVIIEIVIPQHYECLDLGSHFGE